jgi:hypothetical protein
MRGTDLEIALVKSLVHRMRSSDESTVRSENAKIFTDFVLMR